MYTISIPQSWQARNYTRFDCTTRLLNGLDFCRHHGTCGAFRNYCTSSLDLKENEIVAFVTDSPSGQTCIQPRCPTDRHCSAYTNLHISVIVIVIVVVTLILSLKSSRKNKVQKVNATKERLNVYIKMLVSDRFIAVTGIRIFFETGVRQYVKISLLDANKYSLFRILDQMAMKETRGETDAIDKRYRDRILMRLVRYRLIDHHRRSIAERSV